MRTEWKEWTQVFEIRDLATRAPETLLRLDAGGPNMPDIGAMISLAAFVVGWLALAFSTLRSGVVPRLAAQP